MTISPDELAAGEYMVFIQSFDSLGGVFSTLKEDKIEVEVVWQFNRTEPAPTVAEVVESSV